MTRHVQGASLLVGVRVGDDDLTITTRELVHVVIEEIWNRGKLEMADDLFTHDYVNHGGLIPDLLRGPEAIKLSVALYRNAFPAFRIAIDDLATDKAAMVLRWVADCRPTLMDGPASRKGGLRGITRCRLRESQIAETWTVWDSKAAFMQMGARSTRM
jgi:predicted SnoaL-like aldol condensation-catalyzing enzyme